MTIATKKKVAWLILVLNLASLVIFCNVMRFLVTRTNQVWDWLLRFYGWPLISSLAMMAAAGFLIRFYRREPWQHAGHWHLRLTDCFAATFFAAFCMAAWRALWPASFLYVGAGLSILGGVWVLMSLLSAEACGFSIIRHKIPLAAGLMLKSFGYCACAIFVAFLLLVAVIDGPDQVPYWLRNLRGEFAPDNPVAALFKISSWSMLALPAGWVICRVVIRRAGRAISSARPSPPCSSDAVDC